MGCPPGFSWIDKPYLAGMAYPYDAEDLKRLRDEGIDLVVSLTEDPIPRQWVNQAGLMSVHEPIADMTAPGLEQLHTIIETIQKAAESNMGVAVHCMAGKGRTGTVLAAYLVSKGIEPDAAIQQVREQRPGSVETPEQVEAVRAYADFKK